jgi:hypothetical protein
MCDSDAGVIYRRDGRWIAQGAAGKWRVDDGKLILLVTDEEGEDGSSARVEPPIEHIEQVTIVAADEFVARDRERGERRMKRCPAAG